MLEAMYENKLEFPGGGGRAKQKIFHGGSVNIFWNCIHVNVNRNTFNRIIKRYISAEKPHCCSNMHNKRGKHLFNSSFMGLSFKRIDISSFFCVTINIDTTKPILAKRYWAGLCSSSQGATGVLGQLEKLSFHIKLKCWATEIYG